MDQRSEDSPRIISDVQLESWGPHRTGIGEIVSTEDTATMTEFLTARLDEEEAAWAGGTGLVTRPDFRKLAGHMLRDVAAKRAIVARHVEEYPGGVCEHCVEPLPCPDLRDLAAVYADHEDYREEWRA